MEGSREREAVEPQAEDAKKKESRKEAELEAEGQRRSPDEPRPLAEKPGDPPRPRR